MANRYVVKEIFLTLQGEGFHAGRKAVFVRFSGCNLWSGREEDRAAGRGECARWCDTDFVGGEPLSAAAVAQRCSLAWGTPDHALRYCVLTGGEPSLQVDGLLVDTLGRFGFRVAVETNGTRPLPAGLGWTTVSPKAGGDLAVRQGDELKVAWPQSGLDLDELARLDFAHRFLQLIAGPDLGDSTRACVERCLADPRWRLSIQANKVVGLP